MVFLYVQATSCFVLKPDTGESKTASQGDTGGKVLLYCASASAATAAAALVPWCATVLPSCCHNRIFRDRVYTAALLFVVCSSAAVLGL